MAEVFDITIVGGGPTGLFSAFYAGMREAKTKIIESLPQLGGQPALLFSQKNIYDVPAHPAITGQTLTQELIKQIDHFKPEICLNEEVLAYEKEDGIFKITSSKGTHYSKTILLTVGPGAFTPRKLDIDGTDGLSNLAYTVQDLEDYRDQKVVILGGGDSAVDWALALEDISSEVHLVHRRDSFRAHEYSVAQLVKSSVQVHTPFLPEDILISDGKAQEIILKEVRGDEKRRLNTDQVIVNYGFSSSLGPLLDWGLEIERQKVRVNRQMETSIEGIYAAGDIATYPGKIDLIATGFGEAPVAVSHAVRYIRPEEHLQPIQSTKLHLKE